MDDAPQQYIFPHPILIVDDDRLIRTVLEGSLRAAGYDVVSAADGREALEIFRSGYYPIVMTDWVMPEMDGLELCRAIRGDASGRYAFIILLTSQSSKNDIIAGLEAGADEYLIKPPHQNELLTRLKTARRIIELESRLNRYAEEVASLSLVDPLTGVGNRRYLEGRIPQEIKRAYRYGRSLSVILGSIDRFREIVVAHGHFAGDQVLKTCADCLADSVRKEIDWLARYGEEVFVAVLPETDAAGATILAKRLRFRIASLALRHGGDEFKVTASFGVAGFTPTAQKEGFSMQMLLDRADECLQKAIAESGDTIKGVQIT
jgi:diguanylate cyclase (GGDEF)-like protein